MKLKALVVALASAGIAASALAAKGPAPKQEFKALKAEMAQAKAEAAAASGPSAADVGDADSFGRYAKYIGVMSSGSIQLSEDCTPVPGDPPAGPDDHCVTLNPQPAITSFSLTDVGRMVIPGKSSNSLLCHWQLPIAITQWQNLSGATIPNARIVYTPSYTFQNAALNDPALVDPASGLPLNGQITVSLAGIRHHQTLEAGEMKLERDSESRVCLAGALSKAALKETYGLSDAQVKQFFQGDTVVTMNLTGQAQGVVFSSIIVGTRWMGD